MLQDLGCIFVTFRVPYCKCIPLFAKKKDPLYKVIFISLSVDGKFRQYFVGGGLSGEMKDHFWAVVNELSGEK